MESRLENDDRVRQKRRFWAYDLQIFQVTYVGAQILEIVVAQVKGSQRGFEQKRGKPLILVYQYDSLKRH